MKVVIFISFLVFTAINALQGGLANDEQTAVGFRPMRGIPLVLGGKNAKMGQYPHQVSLQVKESTGWFHTCSGSLVASDVVLTPAQCLYGRESQQFRIVAGEHDLFKYDGTEQYSFINSILLHPNYNPLTSNYDYAKLRFSPPLELNNNVGVIKMASPEDQASMENCTVSGWGIGKTEAKEVSSILQTIDVPMVERSACNEMYGNNKITDRMICAGGSGIAGCSNDIGGPLQCSVSTVSGPKTILVGGTIVGTCSCA